MKDINVEKLIDILDKEYQLYQKMYELSKKKQKVIINEEIESLEKIVGHENKILEGIIKLEKVRQNLVGDRNISDLIESINGKYNHKLKELQSKISDLVEELRIINQLNGSLINNSLQLTNMTLNLLTNNTRQGNYGKKGNSYDRQKQRSFINHKA
ncbi:flagellar biosynthesis/type III secretory pathway chaperone [Orenia metallireducens]|uniref:Flagellar biosynthesis/type III secretory pathway chaperone n=1 Tax=Orenia metallireducens TaxID=1413210 RepID=A0A285GBL5_9FIRM|nr:flagellar protein FlgN [Orenia metallireducens]PRX32575.1 flagellar biosynthesis/type III secretory pathway chaperone [Orenia metallireducens]SNY20798.1 Flagellar biosynthesis/type III secretory pathway chaperone [Orenia metallireducens]